MLSVRRLVSIVAAMLSLSGCMWFGAGFPRPDAGPYMVALGSSAIEDRIVVAVESLGLTIQEKVGGKITTSPELFKGPERGVWMWKKTWQERTSYTIIILPERSGEFTINVYARTEQRPNSSYPWEPAPSDDDKQRANRLMQKIIEQAGVGHAS